MTSLSAPLGVLGTVRAVARGSLDPRAAIAACAARARACEGAVGAFTILAEVEGIAPGGGPLAGVAVGVKDIIATKDMPTACGSPIFDGHMPAEDAAVVARLKALSAVVMGKTTTTEFAWRNPTATRNPWNLGHTPGGSSAGSAVAVACGAVDVALGTQTYGSVIRPAAYNGVVGLKPSFGSIPRAGVHPLAQSLDHVGLFARGVDDAAYILSLLMEGDGGPAPAPAFQVPLDGLSPFPAPRIGLLMGPEWDQMASDQRETLRRAAELFAKAGAIVETLTLPAPFQELRSLALTLCTAEGAYNLGALADRFPDKTSPHAKALVDAGRGVAAQSYIQAIHAQAALRRDFGSALSGFDVLLTAPAYGEAPDGLGDTGDPALCVPWTALGVPAITLPAGLGEKGLPLGIQLVAPFAQDHKLLRVAKACEQALAYPAPLASPTTAS